MISSAHHKKMKGEQILHNNPRSMQVTGYTGYDVACSASRKKTAKSKTDCKLCDILRESEKDETFIARLEFGSLFLHRNQSYLGRCLYVSNVHVDNFPNIHYELFVNLNREMLLICRMIEKTFQPDLLNFASLGNAIRHFHYHIIPRYNHDSNWGGPPWPAEEKNLTEKDFARLTTTIRTSLEEFYG